MEVYENMLAIVFQQLPRGREAEDKHAQEAADSDQLFEPDEEAADNSSLSDLNLEQEVSFRMRFTKNRHQLNWNHNISSSNPFIVLKHDRRGGHKL